MAKFISSLITEASGSVAGTTYSRNKNGSYIRNKSVPVNRNTQAQQAARALFSAVSSSWKTLTPSQRETWEANIMSYPYVDSLGQTKYYTASQLYKSINSSLAQVGLPTIANCQTPLSLQSVVGPEIIAQCGLTPNLTIDALAFSGTPGTEVPTGFNVLIYATAMKSAGFSSPKNSDYRFIGAFQEGFDLAGTNLGSAYSAVFGDDWKDASSEGNKIAFGFKMIIPSTGQRNNAYSVAFESLELTV